MINREIPHTPSVLPGIDGPSEIDVPPEVDDRIDRPILAINYKNKYLGGAFWKSDDNALVILADIQCANVIDMIDLGSLQ
jgi:hypothetical protein